jgi:hypothetical protein
MEKAYSREREDLLGTIRQLAAQLKLKTLVLDYFMLPEAQSLARSSQRSAAVRRRPHPRARLCSNETASSKRRSEKAQTGRTAKPRWNARENYVD